MLLTILAWLLEGLAVATAPAREVLAVTTAAARDPPTSDAVQAAATKGPSGGIETLGGPGQGRECVALGRAHEHALKR